jgi:uncharacterized membrane protein
MSAIAFPDLQTGSFVSPTKAKRIESIDLLRGIVMIIMALDHVRDYFHYDAFVYSPTDLEHTTVFLFFTRFITHYCAPVFVFLAGISAHLYGLNKSRKALSAFLFSRGIFLVFAELFILSLFRTFDPLYHFFNLQVIWAIGISMVVLSALIYLNRQIILLIGILLIGGHNLLDNVHFRDAGAFSFIWSVLHETGQFNLGRFTFQVRYPLMPWTGIMAIGYYAGHLFSPGYNAARRKEILLLLGMAAIVLFIILRLTNIYGDPADWSMQRNNAFSLLSLLNVTKYPPSLLYTLITLGPALIFLALFENMNHAWTRRITVFGRTPMFYYLAHILLIHLFAVAAAVISGYKWEDMILTTMVNSSPQLKGYGFNLLTVYIVWTGLVLLLYPCCKWFDRYKRAHHSTQRWLSYV